MNKVRWVVLCAGEPEPLCSSVSRQFCVKVAAGCNEIPGKRYTVEPEKREEWNLCGWDFSRSDLRGIASGWAQRSAGERAQHHTSNRAATLGGTA